MQKSKNKKLLLNASTALLLQIISIACNFILSRCYLQFFNSEINGLIQSISQFLGFVSLCELGIGQVIQSALYKPLAENDTHKVNCVFASGNKFFRRIAYILFGYVIVLIIVFSALFDTSFTREYLATLILAMSISSFAQYYFGIIDSLLLNADEKNYINSISHIASTLLNTVVCVILIIYGLSLQVVKLCSSLILIIRPIAVHLYVRKKYRIDKKVRYEGEPIAQKWNGIAQHIASYVLSGTDTMVLTVFSTLGNVSIYSIYHMITNGVNLLLHSFLGGLRSYFGKLWANENIKEMKTKFKDIEVGLHSLTIFLYVCTGLLIVPFVRVYTQGITDYDYVQPLFAFLLVLSFAIEGIRMPYIVLIHAAGQYKQTQNCYLVTAAINLIVSLSLVSKWGLIGVAIGTSLSLLVQIVWLVIYNSKHILNLSLFKFGKLCCIDILGVILSCVIVNLVIPASLFFPQDFYEWVILALAIAFLVGLVILALLLFFYRKAIKTIFSLIKFKTNITK